MEKQDDENPFGLPRGLTVLPDGTVLVVDAFEFELVRISEDGEEIARFGARGVEPAEFNFPNGIDSASDRVGVADKENDRIQILELVK
jgi:hypothetical protein